MLEIINKVDNPAYLVITPLRPEDEIYPVLKETIFNNRLPFDWVSYRGNNNIPMNTQLGYYEYCKQLNRPEYFIKVDNDIKFGKVPTLDMMALELHKSNNNVAYCYCSFKFSGLLNAYFKAGEFSKTRLLDSNYISSVSMIKSRVFEKYNFITDDKYVRLLDWCYWLHLMRHGFIGTPCEGFFEAIVDKPGISNGPNQEYFDKKKLVIDDFIRPYLKEFLC